MPLSESLIKRAAAQILKGRLKPPLAISHLDEDYRPLDLEDSMKIQDALHELLTAKGFGRLAGTKIGCTTNVCLLYTSDAADE